jgi:oxygen-independent coproporphyrinogen-3 oxidase
LAKEVELYTSSIGMGQSVSQLHLGGGTPTFLSNDELREWMSVLKRSFNFVAGGEYSVEVDPRTVNEERLALLFELGFNRLSFGVQDFDPEVQKAVHRIQPAAQVFDLMAAARKMGFESVNVDLIYGLPKQTPESFDRTLKQVNDLRPDRIALYAYAHLPERFKPQRRILAAELPVASSKIAMLSRSLDALMNAGYVYVGMDDTPRPFAPKFPRLQHPARLRFDRPWRIGHWSHGGDLQPKRENHGGVCGHARQRPIAHRQGFGFVAR